MNAPAESDLAQRFKWLTLIAIVAWLVFAAQYAVQERWRTVGIDVAAAVLSGLPLLWSRGAPDVRTRLATHLVVGVSTVALVAASLLSGQGDAMSLWFLAVVPVVAGYFDSNFSATAWAVVVALAIAGVHVSQRLAPVTPEFVATGTELMLGRIVMVGVVLALSLAWRASSERTVVRERFARERLELLVENVGLALAFVDRRDRIVFANDSMAQLATSEGPLDGQDIRRVLAPFFEGGTDEPVREVSFPSGRWYELERFTLSDVDEIERLYAVRDVTARREVERKKQEFVAVISHELRTPLASVRGAVSLLRGLQGSLSSERSEELIAMAERNVKRLDTMIEGVLDLKPDATPHPEHERTNEDLTAMVENAVEASKSTAAARSVELHVDAGDSVIVNADRPRIEQVISQLVVNAIKHGPVGAAVVVTVRSSATRARVEVADEGPGVSIEDSVRIFEPFEQVDSSDRRTGEGLGIGLAIAKQVIEAHGGDIGLDRRADAEGSTFFFELPLVRVG